MGPLRTNTLKRSRKQIAHHYDLGNDLFALMLDETMTYSAGDLSHPDATLRRGAAATSSTRSATSSRSTASRPPARDRHRLGRACRPRRARYGCRVTTTTISREQHELALRRVREAGVQDRVTVLLEDYRDLRGRYDKLVSIEMIEAVGWRNFDTFFAQLREAARARRADAAAGDHDRRPLVPRREGDALVHPHLRLPRRLPAVARGHRRQRRAADRPAPIDLEDITAHYVPTLATLARELRRATPRSSRRSATTSASGACGSSTSPTARRGFAERRIQDVQLLLAKPELPRRAARRSVARAAA